MTNIYKKKPARKIMALSDYMIHSHPSTATLHLKVHGHQN